MQHSFVSALTQAQLLSPETFSGPGIKGQWNSRQIDWLITFKRMRVSASIRAIFLNSSVKIILDEKHEWTNKQNQYCGKSPMIVFLRCPSDITKAKLRSAGINPHNAIKNSNSRNSCGGYGKHIYDALICARRSGLTTSKTHHRCR